MSSPHTPDRPGAGNDTAGNIDNRDSDGAWLPAVVPPSSGYGSAPRPFQGQPPIATTPPAGAGQAAGPQPGTPGSNTPGSTTPGATTPGATTPGATTPGFGAPQPAGAQPPPAATPPLSPPPIISPPSPPLNAPLSAPPGQPPISGYAMPPGPAPLPPIRRPGQPGGMSGPALAPLPIPSIGTVAHRREAARIGLWGSSQAGKSTFLGALPIAALQAAPELGNWVISGVGETATTLLVDGVDQLVRHRRFPVNTLQPEPYSWAFHGTVPARRGWSKKETLEQVEFALELQDAPGEFFRSGAVDDAAIDHLASARGIIYLFDPVLDAMDNTRSFDFFYATLQQLTTRIRDSGQLQNGRLPHHVSVCVSKFDDQDFFMRAVEAGWVTQTQWGARLPSVPAEHGQRFFGWVCRSLRGGTAEHVQDALSRFFHAGRVRYHATSAIGFRLNENGIFDYRDFSNVERLNGIKQIRNGVRPINVLEPLLDLERRIRGPQR